MKKFKEHGAYVLLGAALVLASACSKDGAYDDLTKSDGIYLTIGLSDEGFTLPLGSTDKIFLTEMIDSLDSESIHIDEDGQYYVGISGDMGSTDFSIRDIKLDMDPEIESREFSLFLDYNWGPLQPILDSRNEGDPLDDLSVLGHKIISDNIWAGTGVEKTEFVISARNVDRALKDLYTATFREDSKATLSLTLNNLPCASEEYTITLHDVCVVLPSYVNLSHGVSKVPYPTDSIKDLGENGTITLTKPAGATSVSWTSHEFIINGLHMPEDAPQPVINGRIDRIDTLILIATTEISSMAVSATDLKVGPKNAEGHRTAVFKNPVQVNTSLDVLSCHLASVDGRFDPYIAPAQSTVYFEISDNLNFLKDDDVVLDVANPTFHIHMDNPCKAKLIAQMSVEADNGRSAEFKDVIIRPTENNILDLWFSALDDDPAHDRYACPTLNKLIQPFPNSFDVKLEANVDTVGHYLLEVGKREDITGDYEVRIPFLFNAIDLTYDEEIEDVFDDDMSDYVSTIQDVTMSFSVINAIPLNLALTIDGRDKNGNEDPSLVKCTPTTIAAGSLANPVTSRVATKVSIPDVSAVKDLIVRVRVHGEGCDLNGHQYVKFEDMKMTLRDLTIDCNEK
jgi:hypothetical protein